MELALEISTVAMWLALVVFMIPVIRVLKTKGAKPVSHKTWKIVTAPMFLVGIWKFVLEFLNRNFDKCAMAILMMVATAFTVSVCSQVVKQYKVEVTKRTDNTMSN